MMNVVLHMNEDAVKEIVTLGVQSPSYRKETSQSICRLRKKRRKSLRQIRSISTSELKIKKSKPSVSIKKKSVWTNCVSVLMARRSTHRLAKVF